MQFLFTPTIPSLDHMTKQTKFRKSLNHLVGPQSTALPSPTLDTRT